MGDNYILRSDDGQLYRVSKEQLDAYKLGPNDPAHAQAGDLAKIADAAKKATMPIHTDAVCLIAMKDKGKSKGS